MDEQQFQSRGDHLEVISNESALLGWEVPAPIDDPEDTVYPVSRKNEPRPQGEQVLECLFDEELGIHAKLCLIFSRRGVLPQKIVFSGSSSFVSDSLPSKEVFGGSCQGHGPQGRVGALYAVFHGSPEQTDSILREMTKTVGVWRARLGVS